MEERLERLGSEEVNKEKLAEVNEDNLDEVEEEVVEEMNKCAFKTVMKTLKDQKYFNQQNG